MSLDDFLKVHHLVHMPPPSPPQIAQSNRQYRLRKRPWPLLIILCIASSVLLFCGHYLYQLLENSALREHGENLHSITQLKTNQILSWRQERLADARMHASGMVRALSQQWLQTSQTALLDDIRQRLQFFQDNEEVYTNMMLTDGGGRILLSLLPRISELDNKEHDLINRVVTTNQPVLGDFFYCGHCNQVHLEVAAPVLTNERTTLVLILVADPQRDLYPMLQSWPTTNNHAESILVRKEGDDVLFLNQLRKLNHPPLSYKQSLSQENTIASQAVHGVHGTVRSTDYRGVDILANVHPVPETDWFMVTKIDTEEILADVRYRAGAILLVGFLATALAGILVQFMSLSRRKALSEALLAEEREHRQTRGENRATLYSIADGVIATDDHGIVTRMNPSAETLTGWSEAEALGKSLATVYRIVDEENDLPVELPVDRVLKNEMTAGLNKPLLLIAKNNRRCPITDSASPIRNESGVITGVVLVFRDQTKRRAMEKAQAESTKRYSDLVESLSDFIWETGPDHRYSFASSRSIDLFGYTPEEFVGKSWFDILAKEIESPEDIAQFQNVLANRLPYTQLCRTFVRKDCRLVVLESSARPAFDPQGHFLGYRGVSRDITERKKAEEAKQKLEMQLLQSQKMEVVGKLAGGVAHDFNNMLTVITSYVEMALHELDEDHRLYKRLREVHHAALHSADLTRQLLAFARKQDIAPQIISLNETITGTLRMLHRLIGENIDLIWEPSPKPLQVLIDPAQLGQILANLTVNARDAIVGTGQLVIATDTVTFERKPDILEFDLTPGQYALITVSDNGCGMDKATISRIFEPFFTTKTLGRGTGLGLSTVYGIVKQNKGAIEVTSTPGEGTVFCLYFPIINEERSSSPQDNQQDPSGSETLLLVEDEHAILDLGRSILEKRGYTVLAASTPTRALILAKDYPETIDLLVTDVIMPEMNGQQLANAIKLLRPGIKILFMSGYTADIISQHNALKPGVQLIEKPFSSRSLGKKIREVLDQP